MFPGRLVLLVAEEQQLTRWLRVAFNQLRVELCECQHVRDAHDLVEEKHPEVVLLDLRVPGMSNVEAIRALREQTTAAMLAYSDVADEQARIDVLDAGADDYLTIPFGRGELLARIRAVLRRVRRFDPAQSEETFRLGGLEVDFLAREVRVHGKTIHLTPTEYKLLGVLIASAGRVVPHAELLSQVWGPDSVDEIQYLRVYMKQLRQKLEHATTGPRYLVTEPSVGYRLRLPTPRPDPRERLLRPAARTAESLRLSARR
jgi:two-component system KDP operon response regulator KdpE